MKQQETTQKEITTGILESGKFQLRYRIEGQGIPTIVIGNTSYYPRVFSETLRKTACRSGRENEK